MPRHEDFTHLTNHLTEENDQNNNSTKRAACLPQGLCGLCVCLGLLCGYLIHESYLIEDGSL